MRFTSPLAVLAAGALALGATACGGDDQKAAKPLAQIDRLTGASTAVKLDPGFVDALTSLKVAPAPVGDASLTSAGYASFPITGGNLKYFKPGTVSPYVQGRIYHESSGLSLTAGSTKVELTAFLIEPGKSLLTANVAVNGKPAAESAPLFFLDGRTLQPLAIKTSNQTAVLVGTTVRLKREAADLLNKAFKVDALKAGQVVGVARITADTS